MIYLNPNSLNHNVSFVCTAPAIFTFRLESKIDRRLTNITCTNKLPFDTMSDITIGNVMSGEYIYHILGANNVELERGICVISETNQNNTVDYNGGNTTVIAYEG